MSERDLDRLLDQWMNLGPTTAPERVAAAASLEARSTRQSSRLGAWLSERSGMNSKSVRYGIAAVAVVALAVIGWRFLPGSSTGGGPNETPTPTQTPIVTPTPIPTGPMALVDLADQTGTAPAGDYYLDLPAYPARIDFTLPEGWFYWTPTSAASADTHVVVVNSEDTGAANGSSWGLAFMLVDRVRVNPCSTSFGYMDASATQSSEAIAAAMATWTDFPTTVTDVTIGGFSGKRVEVRVADTVSCRSVLFSTPTGYGFEIGPGRSEPFDNPVQFTFLDVGDSLLAIWTTDYPGTNAIEVDGGASPDPAAHVADQVALHEILDSIVITPH
jgi:hypothetical protein